MSIYFPNQEKIDRGREFIKEDGIYANPEEYLPIRHPGPKSNSSSLDSKKVDLDQKALDQMRARIEKGWANYKEQSPARHPDSKSNPSSLDPKKVDPNQKTLDQIKARIEEMNYYDDHGEYLRHPDPKSNPSSLDAKKIDPDQERLDHLEESLKENRICTEEKKIWKGKSSGEETSSFTVQNIQDGMALAKEISKWLDCPELAEFFGLASAGLCVLNPTPVGCFLAGMTVFSFIFSETEQPNDRPLRNWLYAQQLALKQHTSLQNQVFDRLDNRLVSFSNDLTEQLMRLQWDQENLREEMLCIWGETSNVLREVIDSLKTLEQMEKKVDALLYQTYRESVDRVEKCRARYGSLESIDGEEARRLSNDIAGTLLGHFPPHVEPKLFFYGRGLRAYVDLMSRFEGNEAQFREILDKGRFLLQSQPGPFSLAIDWELQRAEILGSYFLLPSRLQKPQDLKKEERKKITEEALRILGQMEKKR